MPDPHTQHALWHSMKLLERSRELLARPVYPWGLRRQGVSEKPPGTDGPCDAPASKPGQGLRS
jgi:hypothetical protein